MYDSANAESCELNGWGEKFWAFLDFFKMLPAKLVSLFWTTKKYNFIKLAFYSLWSTANDMQVTISGGTATPVLLNRDSQSET